MTRRRARRASRFLLILLSLSIPGVLAAQVPGGPVFRVNTVTPHRQESASVSMDGAGRTVVQWTDENPDSTGTSHGRIAVQRFDPQGKRSGSELVCNENEAYLGFGAFMTGGGEYVSLWGEDLGFQHYARSYLATGQPSGEPVRINSGGILDDHRDYLTGFGLKAGGEFVRVGQKVIDDNSSPAYNAGTFAQWFDRHGKPLTGEILLPDAYLVDGEPRATPFYDVLAGPDRSVVIGWTYPEDPKGAYWGIHVQAYSVTGQKLGPEFLFHNLGELKAGLAWNPATRNYVVAWKSPSLEEGVSRILFQRLDLQGQPVTPEPTVISKTGSNSPVAVACNNKGYCAVTWYSWYRHEIGIVVRIVRPDGSAVPAEIPVARVYAYPDAIAYGGNGTLMVVWTDENSRTDPADVMARRMIASPGDEVCQRVGSEVRCDAGRTGSLPELKLTDFHVGGDEALLFGDVDGDGRADPCRVRRGLFRCDTDHEGGAPEKLLRFTGSGSGTPLLGDLDGDGRAEACSWSAGALLCDTARNGGEPELSVVYGKRGETPLLGDLDGDGRDDLCMAFRGLLRCDTGHDGGRTETRLSVGEPWDVIVLGDYDGNGTDDPCLVRSGKLLCDTAHDGGEPDAELLLGTPGAPVLLGNLDGV